MKRKPVVSLEDRVPQLRQRRRKRANRRLVGVVLLFVFMIIIVLYFQSPYSKVQNIQISGNSGISEELAIQLSGISTGDPYWTLDIEEAEIRLKDNNMIKNAEIKRDLPLNVEVSIEEYDKVALSREGQQYKAVYENGFISEPQPVQDINFSAPVLNGFQQGQVLSDLASALSNLPGNVLNSISEVHYSPSEVDSNRIVLYMNDGFEVHAVIPTLVEKMTHYPSIVSQLDPEVKGVIDLEVGSYFRAYNAGETANGDTEEALEEQIEEAAEGLPDNDVPTIEENSEG
ncbi:cell division protein FtsQ/DivIB [Jeotgalibacillus haloalkalitolerans]|uniref:Cell division protein DivIB n=1 Tax=Jeotgalibacillus haloalkalitolerans TaxID=3104292 RepID=A0ABU5KLI1_9BACL|nr:FtsQ-type POTRA domain-containing protein [Jeotgalibacillus sp. HH7-29]MDZ5711570.1 FtsQ-type POTRA domain-containing protein [Jeotgalibacillus sp. HH7-29]